MDRSAQLSALIERWLALQDKGESLSVESFCRDCPELLEEFRQRAGVPPPDQRTLPAQRKHPLRPAQLNLEFLRPAEQSDELGRLGPYRVLQVLGQGGMGMVLRADDPNLRRQVALKVILPSLAEDPAVGARFFARGSRPRRSGA